MNALSQKSNKLNNLILLLTFSVFNFAATSIVSDLYILNGLFAILLIILTAFLFLRKAIKGKLGLFLVLLALVINISVFWTCYRILSI